MIYTKEQIYNHDVSPSEKLEKTYRINDYSFQNIFAEEYLKITGKSFDGSENDGEAQNLYSLIWDYISANNDFYENPLLKNKPESRSLDKGLLIVGPVGTGKTSIIYSLCSLFRDGTSAQCEFTPHSVLDEQGKSISIENEKAKIFSLQYAKSSQRSNPKIKFKKAEKVVEEYESKLRGNANEFDSINSGPTLFVIDDILAERVANNFGDKLETFKRILEDMEYRPQPFILTCNKHDSFEKTMQLFAERYGPRAHDRLFSSLNFVELKGKSLRK